MSDVHAAIGLGQLTTIETSQDRREKLARRYLENLSDLTDYLNLPQSEPPARHGWHLFIVRLRLSRLSIDRHQFVQAMALIYFFYFFYKIQVIYHRN